MTNAENAEMIQQGIMNSLFELMKEKNFDSITMTELASKAGYGRATLYRYFQSKEDVIRYYFSENVKMFEDIGDLSIQKQEDYYEIIFRVFSALKDNKEIVRRIIDANLEVIYLDFMNKAMEENFRKNHYNDNQYSSYYFAGSLFNVSMKWIKNDCEESVKYISDAYYEHMFIHM